MPKSARSSAKYCSQRCRKTPTVHSPGALLWNGWKTRRKAIGLPCGERKTPSVADLVLRDGLDCHICGAPIDYTIRWNDRAALTVDHVIPVSDPRSFHAMENLKLAHRSCNLWRSDRIHNDWREA